MRATLAGSRDRRHEHARTHAERLGREGDRRAVVAARGGGAAGGRGRAGQEIVERAARLERTGKLQAFELQRQGRGAGRAAKGSRGSGAADMRGDARACAARTSAGVTRGGGGRVQLGSSSSSRRVFLGGRRRRARSSAQGTAQLGVAERRVVARWIQLKPREAR